MVYKPFNPPVNVRLLRSILRRVWRSSSRSYVLYLLLSFGVGLLTPLLFILQQRLMDNSAWGISPLAGVLALYGIALYLDACAAQSGIVLSLQAQRRVERESYLEIIDSTSKVAYATYESAAFQDILSRLDKSYRDVAERAVLFVPKIVQASVELATIFICVILAGVWWSFPLAVAVTLPAFHFNRLRGEYARRVWRGDSREIRYAAYLQQVLSDREHARERRFFGFVPALSERWREVFAAHNRNKLNLYLRSSLATGVAMCFSMATIIIFGLSCLLPLSAGRITLGFYTALLLAITGKMNMAINMLVNEVQRLPILEQFEEDLEALRDAAVTTNMEQIEDLGTFQSLVFERVSFRYPGREEAVLREVCFTIRAGERVGLVGINGAGKTTLTRLMLGIYQPTSGRILLNGQPLAAYSQAALQRLYGVTWQSFACYKDTLGVNIALSDLEQHIDAAAASRALRLAGAEELLGASGRDETTGEERERFEVLLAPEFGGRNLSGGQWQKVALARALYGDREFLIFDEPTAALDPLAEVAFYDHCEQILAGKTCLYITHRLGSTYLFDRNLVLATGRIAEEGSHQELIELKGIYAELFATQQREMANYK